MEFPETPCERNVLNCLGLPNARSIPFGVMLYIHAACRGGFASLEIATRACRLLCWPAICKKLSEKYPNLLEEDEAELREYYLGHGAGSGLQKKLVEFLSREKEYAKSAETLRKMLEAEELQRRKKAWEDMLAQSSRVRSLSFVEWMQIDYDLFDLSLQEAQNFLVAQAEEESLESKRALRV